MIWIDFWWEYWDINIQAKEIVKGYWTEEVRAAKWESNAAKERKIVLWSDQVLLLYVRAGQCEEEPGWRVQPVVVQNQ